MVGGDTPKKISRAKMSNYHVNNALAKYCPNTACKDNASRNSIL